MTERVRKLNEAERREADRLKAIKEEERLKKQGEDYATRIAKWLSFKLEKDGVRIQVIPSVEAVQSEGEAMHHCVFQCGYYRIATSLLLSATDADGNRLETIEYSLKDYKVLQSRGLQNKPSNRHKTIVAMMQSAKGQIMQINTSKRALTA